MYQPKYQPHALFQKRFHFLNQYHCQYHMLKQPHCSDFFLLKQHFLDQISHPFILFFCKSLIFYIRNLFNCYICNIYFFVTPFRLQTVIIKIRIILPKRMCFDNFKQVPNLFIILPHPLPSCNRKIIELHPLLQKLMIQK